MSSNLSATVVSGRYFLRIVIGYGLFIVYGSLLPFEINDRTLEMAWAAFKKVPLLNLGVYSRADWIANILLYIPFSFFLSAVVIKDNLSLFFKISSALFVLLVGSALAVGVEFFQLFFPPRTVSQNDLIAEFIGTNIGIFVWLFFGLKLVELSRKIAFREKESGYAFLILYSIFYLILSFFPFDFVVSSIELSNNLAVKKIEFINDFYGQKYSVILMRSGLEMFAVIPLGFLIYRVAERYYFNFVFIFIVATIFSVTIEALQLFLITGVSQGISIFSKIFGIIIGAVVCKKIHINFRQAYKMTSKFFWRMCIIYVFVLCVANGWSFDGMDEHQGVAEKVSDIKWLPFYYHYYVSEVEALTSLMYVVAMYAPIGVGYWLWQSQGVRRVEVIVVVSIMLAVFMEVGKLFFSVKHPDPTNLIIAGFSSFLGFHLTDFFSTNLHDFSESKYFGRYYAADRLANNGFSAINVSEDGGVDNNFSTETLFSPASKQVMLGKILRGIAWLLIGFIGWKIVDYPVLWQGMLAFMFLYGVMIWVFPQAWLIAVPALLPVFDFAPWTGRFFLSEFDYIVLVTVAISMLRGRWSMSKNNISGFFYFLLLLFIFSLVLSFIVGFFPIETIDENSFANYYSHYNSLRVGKGFMWALLLFPVLKYSYKEIAKTRIYFSTGILLGLLGVSLVAIWERFLFTGLFNYESAFRITSTFSSMHTGGGHIDAYLVLTIPFIVFLVVGKHVKFFKIILAIVLLVLGLYTLMVTFSRGPYMGFAIEFILLFIFLYFYCEFHQKKYWLSVFVITLIASIVWIVVVPVINGGFIKKRLGQVSEDYEIRTRHWLNTIHMMDDSFITNIIGMGLGSYPRTYFWRNPDHIVPATYSLGHDEYGSYLKLGAGDSLYFEQKIGVLPNMHYRLSFDVRSNSGVSALTVPICQKALLYAFNCISNEFQLKSLDNEKWEHFEKGVDTESIGLVEEGGGGVRPIKIALYNGVTETILDVKNIAVFDENGVNLIENGDFSRGIDHWFFSTDNHLPWHIKNIWVHIFFDQGWFGEVTFMALLTYIILHNCKHLIRGNVFSMVVLLSISGFIVVGMIDSPFDEPRLTLLFFMIVFSSVLDSRIDV